jgi:hypothetical protein
VCATERTDVDDARKENGDMRVSWVTVNESSDIILDTTNNASLCLATGLNLIVIKKVI